MFIAKCRVQTIRTMSRHHVKAWFSYLAGFLRFDEVDLNEEEKLGGSIRCNCSEIACSFFPFH